MRNRIVHDGEVYDCPAYFLEEYEISKMTWSRWRRANKLPVPLKISNRLYFNRRATEAAIVIKGQI